MKPLSGAIVMYMLIGVSATFAAVQAKTARIGTTTVHYKVVVPK